MGRPAFFNINLEVNTMSESKLEHGAKHIAQLKQLLQADKNYSQTEREDWKKGLRFWIAEMKKYILEEEQWWNE